jgi:hypothetical protein
MDGLTQQQIEELKEEFGSIHAIQVGATKFYFRSLTRVDAAISGILNDDNPAGDSKVLSLSIIYPREEIESLSVGGALSLVNAIKDRSGLLNADSINGVLESARSRKSIYTTLNAIICAAFHILPGELDDLPIDSYMDLLVAAESVHETTMAIFSGEYQPVSIGQTEQENKTPVKKDVNAMTDDERRVAAKALEDRLEKAAIDAGIADGSFHNRYYKYEGNYEMEVPRKEV